MTYRDLLKRYLDDEPDAETGVGSTEHEGEENTDTSAVDDSSNEDGETSETDDDKSSNESEGDNTDDSVSSYVDVIKLPDGMELDKEYLNQYEPILKEAGVTGEQAQKLVDIMVEKQKADAQAQQDEYDRLTSEWTESIKTDKEFGGDKLEESLGMISNFMDKYATPEVEQVLEESGLGNNPDMVRFMYRIAKASKEDQPFDGDVPVTRQTKEQARLNLYKT